MKMFMNVMRISLLLQVLLSCFLLVAFCLGSVNVVCCVATVLIGIVMISATVMCSTLSLDLLDL